VRAADSVAIGEGDGDGFECWLDVCAGAVEHEEVPVGACVGDAGC
jgi:hypothetical protein